MCALLASGCAPPIGVKRISPEAANRSLTANVLNSGQPSATSTEFLYRLDLQEQYATDPASVLAQLHTGLGQADERDRLFALAELSFAYAERGGGQPYYLSAAAYAWAFLFPEYPASRPSPYDPRLRTALDIYNRAVAEGLSTETAEAVDLSPRTVPLSFGVLQIEAEPSGFAYGGYQLTDFTSLADLQVRGLRNRYRRRGIGAPLGARVSKTGDAGVDRWIPPLAKVPVTALLHFDHPRRAMSAGGTLHAAIELYDDDATRSVSLSKRPIPLESETTALLAYRLEKSPLWDFEIAGFRSGDFALFGNTADTGLFMLHPYCPGRIPIVFVHGTASSPARWAEMTNELSNDPILGGRYQFWYFIYNTGNPIAYSSMRLREALQAVIHDVDPDGRDASLHEMVVIGHSQGGLLTKMTAVSSGDRFWAQLSDVPFDQADLDPETRDLLRRSLFVEPLPFVKRLIFIATPHRGSFLADNFLGNVARKLVSLPGNLTRVGVNLVKLQATNAFKVAVTLPTSIDNMKSSSPFLQTLAALPIAPGVRAHSIIPVQGNGPVQDGDDGVVRYRSAHIDGVESEYIVRSGHSTQANPRTIEEVRRILYEHIGLSAPSAGGARSTASSLQ
jgi:pimeloyl-ACP methyl ester carboxylesterase